MPGTLQSLQVHMTIFGKEGEAFFKTETFIMIDSITSIQITRDLNDSDMAHMDIIPYCTRIILWMVNCIKF